jgi:two-component system chemotaxis response regulator CheY
MNKILVADDSQVFVDLLVYALNDAGYNDITIAKDGKEGLEYAQNEQFKLILADVHMPRLDGLSMIEEIRKLPNYKRVPILVLSTEFSDEYKVKGKAAGANGWISKPFIPAQLIKAVSICLNR